MKVIQFCYVYAKFNRQNIQQINRANMRKDSSQIMPQSTVDQQFAYVQVMSGSTSNEKASKDYQSINQQKQELESLPQEQKKVDLFSDPIYVQEVKHLRTMNIKKIAEKIAEEYRGNDIKEIDKNVKISPPPSIICQQSTNESPRDEEPQQERKEKVFRSKKIKKSNRDQYPTKNFLPSFRSSFINYLAKHFDKDYFYNLQIIRRIRGKPCINLKDYEDLFATKQFRPILRVYFKNKVIVRDLMQSRIDYATKRIYMRKIHVFEEAFETGVFNKIN